MKVMSHLKHQSAACLPPVQQYRTYTAGQLDLEGDETASPQRLAFALQVATLAFVLIDRQSGRALTAMKMTISLTCEDGVCGHCLCEMQQ